MQKHTYDPGGKACRSPDNGEPYLFFAGLLCKFIKNTCLFQILHHLFACNTLKKTATYQKSSYSTATFNSSKAKLLGFAKKKLYKFR